MEGILSTPGILEIFSGAGLWGKLRNGFRWIQEVLLVATVSRLGGRRLLAGTARGHSFGVSDLPGQAGSGIEMYSLLGNQLLYQTTFELFYYVFMKGNCVVTDSDVNTNMYAYVHL